jgi:hypothetical protein
VSDCISFFRTFYSEDESLLLTIGGNEGSSLIDKLSSEDQSNPTTDKDRSHHASPALERERL